MTEYILLIVRNEDGSYTVSVDGKAECCRTFGEARKLIEKVERRYTVPVKERRKTK